MAARTKKCSRCQRTLSLDAFHASPRGRLGVQGSCKSCIADRRRTRAATDGAVSAPDPVRDRKPPTPALTIPEGVLSDEDRQVIWEEAVKLAKGGDIAMLKLVLSIASPKAADPGEDPEVSERRWMKYILRTIRELRGAAFTAFGLDLLERLRVAGPEAAARELGIEADELVV